MNQQFKYLLCSVTLFINYFYSANVLSGNLNTNSIQGNIDAADLMTEGKYLKQSTINSNQPGKSIKNKNFNNEKATIDKGMAYLKQLKLTEAELEFNKVLAKHPHNSQAHLGKAMFFYKQLEGNSSKVDKNTLLTKAETECKLVSQNNPEMNDANYYLGLIYNEEQKYNEAIIQFNQVIKANPKYPEINARLGLVELSNNSIARAIELFKKGINLKADDFLAHYGLGQAYLLEGMLDQSQIELNTALELNKNYAPIYLALGELAASKGDTNTAQLRFNEALKLQPNIPTVYIDLANLKETNNDTDSAITELNSGLKLLPDNPTLKLKVAEIQIKTGKIDDAIKGLTDILNNDPLNITAINDLTLSLYLKANLIAAGLFIDSNELVEAKIIVGKALSLAPNNLVLKYDQAKLEYLSGNDPDLSDLPDPVNDSQRIAYAQMCLASNNFIKANEISNQVIDNAKSAKETFAIADLALNLRDLPLAKRGYEKCLTLPNSAVRANIGLDLISTLSNQAKQDLKEARQLALNYQLNEALVKYNEAIYHNTFSAENRLGLVNVLVNLFPYTSENIKKAVFQIKAYISLKPDISAIQLEKLNKRISILNARINRLEIKEKTKKDLYLQDTKKLK